MSSTAEELSSQAEQLQSTIAFFKVAEAEDVSKRAAMKHLTTGHKVNVAPLAKSKAIFPRQQSEPAGVALNLKQDSGRDDGVGRDSEFEKF